MNSILHLIALLVGLGALAIGIGAMVYPEKASAGFGIQADAQAAPYVRATGARDIFIGLVYLYLYWRGDHPALAIISFFTAFVSSADFFVTRKYGSRRLSYFHLGATFSVLAYGYLLTY